MKKSVLLYNFLVLLPRLRKFLF